MAAVTGSLVGRQAGRPAAAAAKLPAGAAGNPGSGGVALAVVAGPPAVCSAAVVAGPAAVVAGPPAPCSSTLGRRMSW